MIPELIPLFLSAVLLAPADPCLRYSFRPGGRYPTGDAPAAMALLSAKQPSDTFLAVANRGSGTVSILRSPGDGTLRPLGEIPTGISPDAIAAADFDFDGDLDLIVAGSASSRVVFLFGDGAGAFTLGWKLDLDGPFRAFAMGRFEVKVPGYLAIATSSPPELVLFRSRGAIGFIPDLLPLPEPPGALLADFFADDDGFLIGLLIPLSVSGDFVNFTLNPVTGVMTLSPPVLHGPADGASTAEDLDGDTLLDLVIASPSGNSVSVFLGDTGRKLRSAGPALSVEGPRRARVLSLDHDAFLDLAVIQDSGRIALFAGNGDGSFESAGGLDPGGKSVAIEAADLNLDFRPDLLVLDSEGGSVSVFLNDHSESPAADCNLNDVPDDCDLRSGTSRDCDGNGIPDECDLAPALEIPPDRSIPLPFPASFLTMADLDRDGDLDLVVGFDPLNQVAIFENRGKGDFLPPRSLRGPIDSTSLILADLDGDRAPEMVFASPAPLSILWNDGKGNFPDRPDEIGPGPIQEVQAADLDGDGRLDLIASRPGSTQLSLFLGRASRRFVNVAPIEVGDPPLMFAAADVDRDGDVDVVAITSKFSLILRNLFNSGDATFKPQRPLTLSIFTSERIEIGDLNGDGFPDLVITGSSGWQIGLIHNNGGGGFQEFEAINTRGAMRGIRAVDIDGDGDLDLVANPLDRQILRNLGGWRFADPEGQASDSFYLDIAAGDLDGDLDPDLVVLENDRLDPVFNDGQGRFGQPLLSLGGYPRAMAAGDLDGDGREDLAILIATPDSASKVAVLREAGDGSVSLTLSPPLPGIGSSMVVGDFTGDGRRDLVFGSISFRRVILIFNHQGMELTYGWDVVTLDQPGPEPSLASGDFDGDGDLDLAVTDQKEVLILLNRGDGNFDAAPSLRDDFSPTAVAAVDLDGDRDLDLAVANASSSDPGFPDNVSIYLNDGQARFGAPRNFAAGRRPMGILALDLDGDGDVDLALMNQSPGRQLGQISILRNDGSARFELPEPIRISGHPVALAAFDANGDGRPDLAVAVEESRVYLHFNHGGEFSKGSLPVRAGNMLGCLATADLHGNGHRDLVAGSLSAGGSLAVLRATLAPPRRYDCDRDGVPDDCQPAQPGRNDCAETLFIRGDANDDGRVDLGDAIVSLVYLFLGGPDPDCLESLDASDDGRIDISDPLWVLRWLFQGQNPIPDPYPLCGLDPWHDALGCAAGQACKQR